MTNSYVRIEEQKEVQIKQWRKRRRTQNGKNYMC